MSLTHSHRAKPRKPLRPVSAGALTVWAVVGLVAGWVLHPIAVQLNGYAPVVSWLQPGVLGVAALILGGVAWVTHKQRKDGIKVEAHRAVNRFVLGRASALVGAFFVGGYVGYAISWLGYDHNAAIDARLTHSIVAAVAALAVMVTGMVLERVCRITEDDEPPTGATPA